MADLTRLNQKQRAQRDILMYTYDVALAERYRDDVLDANGRLRNNVNVNALSDGQLTRAQYDDVVTDMLADGYSIGGTFGDNLRTLEGMGSVDLSGSELDALPDSINPDNNSQLDDMIITLYHEYETYGSTPIVPFDRDNRGINASVYEMNFTGGDYASEMLYTRDGNGVSYIRPLQSTPEEGNVYFSNGNAELRQDFETLLATKTVLAANEFARSYNSGDLDEPMRLSQTLELREAIKLEGSEFRTAEEARNLMVSRASDFLVERGIIKEGPDDNFGDYVASGYGLATSDETSDLALEAVNINNAGLHVVDMFGKKTVNGHEIPVCQMDTAHAFINASRDEQLRSIDGVGIGSFSTDVNDRNNSLRYVHEAIAPNAYLVEDDNYVYRTDGENIIAPGITDGEMETAALADGKFAENAVGLASTENDELGISRLRRFMKPEDYAKLSVSMPTDTTYYDPEVQNRSVENGIAILEELDRRGIVYTITNDEKPTQLKASCSELGLDIRIVDTEQPNFVGRCYGDNLQTYISVDIPMNTRMENGRRVNVWDDLAERNLNASENFVRTGAAQISYMPTPEQAVDVVKYRLGDTVTLSAGIGEAGTRTLGAPGKAVRTSLPPTGRASTEDEIAKSVTGASYASSSNAIAQYGTCQVYFQPTAGTPRQKTVPIRISTQTAGHDGMSIMTPDEAYAALEDCILTARGNFSDQVFGDMSREIAKSVPNYEKDSWTSYRKTAKTAEEKTWAHDEDGYLLDPSTNERIVWRQSSRSESLMSTAGDSLADFTSVKISHDPVVKALQENYISYIEHDDAHLLGVVDGKVQPETIEEFSRRVAFEREMSDMDIEPEVEQLFASLGLNDTEQPVYSHEEKLDHVQQQFGMLADDMFGSVSADGTICVNPANIIKYGGFEEKDVFRMIQAAKKEHNVEFVSENDTFTMNRLKENTAVFNPETSRSLWANGEPAAGESDFMKRTAKTMHDAFVTSGCMVDTLEMDDKGIVHYSVRRYNSNGIAGKKNPNLGQTRIEGYIGQIFEPDERGVIITRFDHDDNYAIVPGYKAVITPGEGSVESRTVLHGYEKMLSDQLKMNIRSQMSAVHGKGKTNATTQPHEVLDAFPTDTLNATALNGVYRHLNDEKYDMDYITELRAKGYTDEMLDAQLDTSKSMVRYSSHLIDESTINAHMAAKQSNIVDNMNTYGYSVTGRDMACLQDSEFGYFDPTATSGSTIQGFTRVLSSGASVDADGRIVPTNDESKQYCALNNMDVCSNNRFNPFDRQQMVFSNQRQALTICDNVNVAFVTCAGDCMEDGDTINKKWAEKLLVETHDASQTALLDPNLIEYTELGYSDKTDAEGHLMTSVEFRGRTYDTFNSDMVKVQMNGKETLIPAYGLNDTSDDSPYKGAKRIEGEEPREYSIGEQVKYQMMDDGIGIRPLIVGDKLCDFSGNKGVISRVVDPDMDDEAAKRLGIYDRVQMFRMNPELSVICAPPSAVSRFNAGTIRGMMFDENGVPSAQDLHLPDGRVIPGGMSSIPMIVTDKTVDEKTHIYDDAALDEGKGRKASSQLAWQLQARGAHEVLRSFYGDNVDNLISIRERMIVMGCDITDDHTFSPHYVARDGETRDVIHTDIKDFGISAYAESVPSKNGNPKYQLKFEGNIGEAKKELVRQIAAKGGVMESPFPIKLRNGEMTPFNEETGKYEIPVIPVRQRTEQMFNDGNSITHNYTRRYNAIAEAIIDYQTAMLKQEVADNLPAPPAGAKNDYGTFKPASKFQEIAQAQYDIMGADMETVFEGKYNKWKHNVMSSRLPNSATAVWTADPHLDLEEVAMSASSAKQLNLRDGDPCIIWRDPQLRPEGIATMKVKVCSEEAGPIVGIQVNPVSVKRYDGDFDGDSVAVVNPRQLTLRERDFMDAYSEAKTDAERLEAAKSFKIKNVELVKAKAAQDEAVIADCNEHLDFTRTMCDLGTTKANPQTPEDVTFALGLKLDISSANAFKRDQLNGEPLVYETSVEPATLRSIGVEPYGEREVVGEDGTKRTVSLLEASKMEDAAKMAVVHKDNELAMQILNDYVHNSFKDSIGSDCISFRSYKDYFESMNTVVVDHKMKGKLGAMEDLAAYMNVSQVKDEAYLASNPLYREYLEQHPEAANDRLAYVIKKEETLDASGNPTYTLSKERVDTSAPFKDYIEPAIECTGKKGYYIETNGVREYHQPDAAHIAECAEIRADMENRYREVERATSIKAFGTGTAGAFSQRGVRGCRDACIADVLEVTYGATQGILQGKHDAKAAAQKYIILKEVLPAVWKGQSVKEVDLTTGKTVVDGEPGQNECSRDSVANPSDIVWRIDTKPDGSPKYVDKQTWAEQYHRICTSSNGLAFDITRERIDNVANVLFEGSKNGNIVVNVYSKDAGCTLDRLAYGGTAETLYQMCREERNLFDTQMSRTFRPDGSLATQSKEIKSTIAREATQVSSETMRQERMEAKAAQASAKQGQSVDGPTYKPRAKVEKPVAQVAEPSEPTKKPAYPGGYTANMMMNQQAEQQRRQSKTKDTDNPNFVG